MAINYVLDTSILVGFLMGETNIVDRVRNLSQVNISIISVGEMLYGAENSSKKEENFNLYLSFFEICNIFSIDKEVAISYAKIRFNLKTTGRPIPENDIWISATAQAKECILVARDKHFLEVGSIIRIEKW